MLQLVGLGSVERGGGRGELVRTSASWGSPEFHWRSGRLEEGSAQGEIGGKVPPPPCDTWGQH
jgi:hypothetical protein